MSNIRSIGFDMDHTLVIYNRETFEALAFRETLRKFIDAGYPEELSMLKFDPNFIIRGLLVDTHRGNLLKVDGHKYVKIAFHGHKRLTKEERHTLYNMESFKAGELLSVDTFFALSEVQLYTEIIDYMNRNPGKITKTFQEVYLDLRRFIDLSHADGSIKRNVMAEPDKYIKRDRYLATTLLRLIEAGKTLWVLTNSGWDYTQCLMSYLFDKPEGDFTNWRDYFEYVVVGAGKPGFFKGSQPFYEVMPDTGLLKIHSGPLSPSNIYQGGNAKLFQRITGYHGDEILYVGDHIYGDIARSKGEVNWRTMLILEELEGELGKLSDLEGALIDIRAKLEVRETLDEELQIHRSRSQLLGKQAERARQRGENKKAHYLQKEQEKVDTKAEERQWELRILDKDIKKLIQDREAAIHPIWGELMKVGLERSRFADQVSEYACIYTSRVSNARFYSPFKKYTSAHDILPHEF